MNRKALHRVILAAAALCVVLPMGGCPTKTSTESTKSTHVKETPEGTKVTTEKTEKKVETTPKNPNP